MAARSKSVPAKPVTFRAYAASQVAARIGRLAFELRNARRKASDSGIHDLRVAIRRLTETLRVFESAFPEKEARKVRKQLREIMKSAGAVRELDIALELAAAASVPPDSSLAAALHRERGQAAHRLEEAVRRAYRRDITSRWRENLLLTT